MKTVFPVIFMITGFLITQGCNSNQQTESPTKLLSEFELQHGTGPITSVVNLQEFDLVAAKRGQEIFSTTCSACHKMNENSIGPKLGDVLERRSSADMESGGYLPTLEKDLRFSPFSQANL